MFEKLRLTLQRKADGVWLDLDQGSKSGSIHCGSPRDGIVNDLIDAVIAAGEFIPNHEEVTQ